MKSPSHTPRIDCFLPYGSKEQITTLCGTLENSGLTGSIYILYHSDMDHSVAERYNSLHIDHTFSTQTIKEIARHCKAEYCLFYHKTLPLDLGFHALDRLLRVADDTQANMVYADHYAIQDGTKHAKPLILMGAKAKKGLRKGAEPDDMPVDASAVSSVADDDVGNS